MYAKSTTQYQGSLKTFTAIFINDFDLNPKIYQLPSVGIFHYSQKPGRSHSRRYQTCSGWAAEPRAPSSWENSTDKKWQ